MKLKITAMALLAMLALSACDPTTIPGGPSIPTVPTTPTTTVTNPASAPKKVTDLKLERVDQVFGDTYNVFFSWKASATPGVKYCASTSAEGSALDVHKDCTFDNPYVTDETSKGFGLVFKANKDYKVQVLAINENGLKSPVASLTWRIPTKVASPSDLKLDGIEQVFGDTYNVSFSWKASSTPNVKYCVSTTSVGIDGETVDNKFDANCSYDDPYVSSDTKTGFGLVFKPNYTYEFRVTAIDANGKKSITQSIIWQLP